MIPKLTTVRDYLRFVFRRKALLLIPALLGVLIAVPIWVLVPPTYRAVATVKRKDLTVIHAAPDSFISGSGTGVPLQTLRFEILTWPRLQSVITELKMDVDLKNDADWQKAYESLQRSVSIIVADSQKAQARGIALIEIAVTDSEADRAMKIANAIAKNYVEESQKVTRGETQEYSGFVEKQAQDYLNKLRRVEDELDEFNRKRYVELPKVKENIQKKLFDLGTSERVLQLQLTDGRTRLEEVEKQLAETPMTLRSKVTSQANPDAVDLERKLRQYEKLLEDLQRRYTPMHPDVKRVEAEVESLKAEIEKTPKRLTDAEEEVVNPAYQELTRNRMQLQQQISANNAARAQTQSWIKAHEIEMRQVVNDEKRYTDLVRQKGEYEEFYQKYRSQVIAAQTRMKVEAGGTEVNVEALALAPYKPYRLKHVKAALSCLAAGLALGVALMFLAEFCDQSLRNTEDAAEFLNIPIMGSVLTIVTPDELGAQRHRRWIVLALIVAVIVVASVVAVMYEHTHSGFTALMLEKVRRFISARM